MADPQANFRGGELNAMEYAGVWSLPGDMRYFLESRCADEPQVELDFLGITYERIADGGFPVKTIYLQVPANTDPRSPPPIITWLLAPGCCYVLFEDPVYFNESVYVKTYYPPPQMVELVLQWADGTVSRGLHWPPQHTYNWRDVDPRQAPVESVLEQMY
jgi:hypothetical protein